MAGEASQLAIDTLLGIMAHSALSAGPGGRLVLMSNIRVDLMAYLFG